MTWFVAVLGLLIVLLGLVGLAQPARFRAMFTTMDSQTRFILAIVTRLAMGRKRLDSLVDGQLGKSDSVLRISALFAATCGGYLVFVAT